MEDVAKKFHPFMDALLGKSGIKTRLAAQDDSRKVRYFRGKDFIDLLMYDVNFADLSKETLELCKSIVIDSLVDDIKKPGPHGVSQHDVILIGEHLIYHKLISSVAWTPLSGEDPSKKKKWPDRVHVVDEQLIVSEGFYRVNYVKKNSWQGFLTMGLAVSVLLLTLFPVWPLAFRVGLWYIMFAISFTFICIILLRSIIYSLLWAFGIDVWLFPALFDEELGPVQSFKPLLSIRRRADNTLYLLFRFIMTMLVISVVYDFGSRNSIEDIQDTLYDGVTDMLHWGVDKVGGAHLLPHKEIRNLEWVKEAHLTISDEKRTIEDIDSLAASDSDDDEVIGELKTHQPTEL